MITSDLIRMELITILAVLGNFLIIRSLLNNG